MLILNLYESCREGYKNYGWAEETNKRVSKKCATYLFRRRSTSILPPDSLFRYASKIADQYCLWVHSNFKQFRNILDFQHFFLCTISDESNNITSNFIDNIYNFIMSDNPEVKGSRTLKLLQNDPASINKNQLNTSSSKMQYSMPKA